jgi:hypothetical protein
MFQETLAIGTSIQVFQKIHQADPSRQAVTSGVFEGWEEEPTGAWYASGRHGKLWLRRLKLRKADGEVSVLTLDDQTRIHPVDAAKK